MKITYSSYIQILICFLKYNFPNLKIIKFATLPANIRGRCSYKQNWIKLNEPNACKALMTLAHEGGHYLSYIRNRNKTGKDYEKVYCRSKREKLAYLYGWILLKIIGATFLISKDMWKEFHEI